VADVFSALGHSLPGFPVERHELITAPDGQYRIDVSLRFTQLEVDLLVLVECKNRVRPVEREDVQVLADGLRATGAQKGILFSTNGFQRGAIHYARSHGIALVSVIEGKFTTERERLAGRPSPSATSLDENPGLGRSARVGQRG
jgi:restriction system protein